MQRVKLATPVLLAQMVQLEELGVKVPLVRQATLVRLVPLAFPVLKALLEELELLALQDLQDPWDLLVLMEALARLGFRVHVGQQVPLVPLGLREMLVLQEPQVLLESRVTQVRQAVQETQAPWGEQDHLGHLEQLVQRGVLETKELQGLQGLLGFKDQ